MDLVVELTPSRCGNEEVRKDLWKATEGICTVEDLYASASTVPYPYLFETITIGIDMLIRDKKLEKDVELTPEICRDISSWISISFPKLESDQRGLSKYGVEDMRYIALDFLAMLSERISQH